MEVSTINRVLGQRAGVLRLVFGLLPSLDLKNVVLVCQLWREVGDPLLWAWVVLRVTRENMSTMAEMLASRRLQTIRKIRMQWGLEVSEELLKAVARHQGLRQLDMRFANMATLEPSLLARVVNRLEEVVMKDITLNLRQWEAILNEISAGDCQVWKLSISGNNLTSVDAGLLARAVKSLEEVELEDTQLTEAQAEAILTAISTGDSKTNKLDIGHNNLSALNPSLLASVVARMEEVEMVKTHLTVQQLEAILADISTGVSQTKVIDISNNELSSLNPSLLTSAVTKLCELRVGNSQLTLVQLKAILTAISTASNKVKKLVLSNSNLSTVDSNLLARAVNSLHEVELNNTKLTTGQVKAILTQSLVMTSLRKLQIRGVNRAACTSSLMARATLAIGEIDV